MLLADGIAHQATGSHSGKNAIPVKPLMAFVRVFIVVKRLGEPKARIQQGFQSFNRDGHDVRQIERIAPLGAARRVRIDQDHAILPNRQPDTLPAVAPVISERLLDDQPVLLQPGCILGIEVAEEPHIASVSDFQHSLRATRRSQIKRIEHLLHALRRDGESQTGLIRKAVQLQKIEGQSDHGP